MRIQATKNISKITKSMKMVSAAKLKGDQQRLSVAVPFAVCGYTYCKHACVMVLCASLQGFTKRMSSGTMLMEEVTDVSAFPQKNLIIPITSDRGLCGGVNSFIARAVRKLLANLSAAGKDSSLIVVGEKGRAQLRRFFPELIHSVESDCAAPITFATASTVASTILEQQFDAVHIVYNRFRSAISYEQTIQTVVPLVDPTAAVFTPYEVEPDKDVESLQNFFEFSFAAQLYYAMLDGATSEQSSRMNAMENASKNAGEMIEKLTLKYNRARQARITTELIEIISGAAALKSS
jgi:F-type H+-transporting ATPase subunit gamma